MACKKSTNPAWIVSKLCLNLNENFLVRALTAEQKKRSWNPPKFTLFAGWPLKTPKNHENYGPWCQHDIILCRRFKRVQIPGNSEKSEMMSRWSRGFKKNLVTVPDFSKFLLTLMKAVLTCKPSPLGIKSRNIMRSEIFHTADTTTQ